MLIGITHSSPCPQTEIQASNTEPQRQNHQQTQTVAWSESNEDSALDPRLFKTIDPNCIANGPAPQDTTVVETVNRFRLAPDNGEMKKDSFLNDLNKSTSHDIFYPSEVDVEISNPYYYQEYVYEDPVYTSNDPQNRSVDSTSYELDSNSTSNSISNSNENINPYFFHNTPSPNNVNSIRIITASNRIAKLKDKKLIQAIHKSLNLRSSQSSVGNCNNHDSTLQNLKTLNDNHSYFQSTASVLSSPRNEITENLNYLIYNKTRPVQNFRKPNTMGNSNLNDCYNYYTHQKILKASKTASDTECANLNLVPVSSTATEIKEVDINNHNNSSKQKDCSSKSKRSDSFKRGFKWKHDHYTTSNIFNEKPEEVKDTCKVRQNILKLNKNIGIKISVNKPSNNTLFVNDFNPLHNKKEHNEVEDKKQSQQRDKRGKGSLQNLEYKYEYQQEKRCRDEKEMQHKFEHMDCHDGTCDHGNNQVDSQSGYKPTRSKNKVNCDENECDVVMEIFRESLKKNRDKLLHTKPHGKINFQAPKITKIKSSKNQSEKIDPVFRVKYLHAEKNLFKCTQCPKVFKQRSQWKRHVDCIHLKIAKFVCIKCDKAFKRSDHLKNHIRRIHASKTEQVNRIA